MFVVVWPGRTMPLFPIRCDFALTCTSFIVYYTIIIASMACTTYFLCTLICFLCLRLFLFVGGILHIFLFLAGGLFSGLLPIPSGVHSATTRYLRGLMTPLLLSPPL